MSLSAQELQKIIEEMQAQQLKLEMENAALRNNQKFLHEVIDKAGDPIFVKDKQSKIILANESFCKIFDVSKTDVIGKTLAEKVPKKEQEHFFKIDRQVLADGIKNTCEETLTLNGGETKTIITTKTRYIDEHGEYFLIGVIRDITERKALEVELNKRANTDHLTGINNRGQFMALASQEISRAIRYKNALSLVMMDIDFFKKINDQHGHIAGDAVLAKLSEVCSQNLRKNDILGRIGGEEFAALLPQTNISNALNVAENLRQLIEDITVVDEVSGAIINFAVSIGVSCLTSEQDTLESLLSNADKALYKAKNNGRNQVQVCH